MAVIVRPLGGVSVIVTNPLVGTPLTLPTMTVYCAPVCPRKKLPEWLLLIVNVGLTEIMAVESVALTPADPPPETETWFVRGDEALPATFAVTVMTG